MLRAVPGPQQGHGGSCLLLSGTSYEQHRPCMHSIHSVDILSEAFVKPLCSCGLSVSGMLYVRQGQGVF